MEKRHSRVRAAALVAALAVTTISLAVPGAASAAVPEILTNGTNWVVDATSPHLATDTLNVAVVARHDPGRRIVGIVADFDGTDDTATLPPTAVSVEFLGSPATNRLASAFVTASVLPNALPSLACDPVTGDRRADTTVHLRLVDDLGERSDVASFSWHVIADDDCADVTDYPALLTATSTARTAQPGQSIFFNFTCNDPDTTGTGDRCDFIQAHWRRVNDGATQTAGTFDAEDNVAHRSVVGAPSDRGLWVLEAQLFTEDGLEDQAWWNLATVAVNQSTPPTGTMSFTGADVVSGAPFSVNQGDPASAQLVVDSAGPSASDRVQVIEWDATADGTFERMEFTGPQISGGAITQPALSAAQLSQGIDTSTPGLFAVRARVTDNGAIDAADQLRRTSATITGQLRVNARPVATDGTASTAEDTSVEITLSATDPDGQPAPLSYEVVNAPAQGTVSIAGNVATYQPDPDYAGPDFFTFRAADGPASAAWSYSNTATVSVDVGATDDAPTATGQSLTTQEDTAVPVVLAGTDPDGDALTFTVVDRPSHGDLTGTAPNLVYRPNTDFHGTDGFTFRVDDAQGGTDRAAVDIEVTSVNDPPTATAQSVTTAQDTPVAVSLAGTDPDTDALAFSVTSGPGHGSQSGAVPNLTYTPNAGYSGPDAFEFQVDDGHGGTATATVEVTVTAGPPPPPPPATTSAFVTGAGWYATPSGKAKFVLHVRNRDGSGKGATRLRLADDHFRATAVDALEVDGKQATYTGVGKYNGNRGFGFRVSVVDAGKRGRDQIRIEIWKIAGGSVVYDSQPTDIKHGEIVIHRARN